MEDGNDRDAPATKGDIDDAEQRLTGTMRDIQTEILKALYTFAESNQTRLRR
jgi:hypothetical protein